MRRISTKRTASTIASGLRLWASSIQPTVGRRVLLEDAPGENGHCRSAEVVGIFAECWFETE
jgi:hypothetical protein